MKWPFLIGRLVFGGYFAYAGINHFLQKKNLTQYVSAKNVPMPDVAVTATGLALLLGGSSILLGLKPKLGTAVIVGFLLGVSPVMHNFWRDEDPNERMHDMTDFMKNMALLGGALALTAVEEPWPASVPIAHPGVVERAKKPVWRVMAA